DKSTKAPNVIPKGSYGYFPDVFHPDFRQTAKEEIEKKLKWHPFAVEDKWLLGYFLSDEPSWYGSKGRRGSLVDDFIALEASCPGKEAWVEYVKGKYQNIDAVNKTWGTNLNSFGELLTVTKIKDTQAIAGYC
ncbi:hypothetical protein ACFL2W_01120, partial [Candidatus Omnitrophota bacterium]